jgi:hypothetical protein
VILRLVILARSSLALKGRRDVLEDLRCPFLVLLWAWVSRGHAVRCQGRVSSCLMHCRLQPSEVVRTATTRGPRGLGAGQAYMERPRYQETALRNCVTRLHQESTLQINTRKSTAGVGGSLIARRLGLTETNKVGNKQANWAWLGILNGLEV